MRGTDLAEGSGRARRRVSFGVTSAALKALKTKLAAIEAVRGAANTADSREVLRKALNDRNNLVVARAAAMCADLRIEALIPEMLVAFERQLVDAAKTDPQCLAKVALVKSLRELGYRGPEPFVRGIGHMQLEPAWGGRADSAAPLRGQCALGLSESSLHDLAIMTHLADALADPDSGVRADAARALEQYNRP